MYPQTSGPRVGTPGVLSECSPEVQGSGVELDWIAKDHEEQRAELLPKPEYLVQRVQKENDPFILFALSNKINK